MVRTKVRIARGMCRSKAHLLAAHDDIVASSETASTFKGPSVHVASVIVIIVGNGEVKRYHHVLEKSSAESCVQVCVEVAHHKLPRGSSKRACNS